MILKWSHFALSDRDAIFDYIEADSPRSAIMVDESIERASDQLSLFPEAGRTGRVPGTREVVVKGMPYILVYKAEGAHVRILRVLHSSQEWPSDFSH